MGEAYSSSVHETPFKVHVNFDIPLFEGLIDVDVVDKWLNLLKGYFCWLWSLIIFLIQRSLLSIMFIPHEYFTP
jgi:hypothetical protein